MAAVFFYGVLFLLAVGFSVAASRWHRGIDRQVEIEKLVEDIHRAYDEDKHRGQL
jgi:hypothetical protein